VCDGLIRLTVFNRHAANGVFTAFVGKWYGWYGCDGCTRKRACFEKQALFGV